MIKSVFEDIDRLHSEWSKMDNAAKMGLLTGKKMQLNRLVNQFSQYIYAKGRIMNDTERSYVRKLIEMINFVDTEGAKLMNDLRTDAFKEIARNLF